MPRSNAQPSSHSSVLTVSASVTLLSAKSNFLAQLAKSDAMTEAALTLRINATATNVHQRDQFSALQVFVSKRLLLATWVTLSAQILSHTAALSVFVLALLLSATCSLLLVPPLPLEESLRDFSKTPPRSSTQDALIHLHTNAQMALAELIKLTAHFSQLVTTQPSHTDAVTVHALPPRRPALLLPQLANLASKPALMVFADNQALAQLSMVAHLTSHFNAVTATVLQPLLNALVTPTVHFPLHSDAPTTSASLT
mmetsp:Transcript_34174/g.39851  ORF Transcript_34174/g.39851 Transcript_34174/m.39851 type:complete len:255 (+) Transcript_34174:803-1567(+)